MCNILGHGISKVLIGRWHIQIGQEIEKSANPNDSAMADPACSFSRLLRKVLETTAPGWIACFARALAALGLNNHEVPGDGIVQKIPQGDTEAVAQEAGVRHLVRADLRAQLRLEDRRTVISKIDQFASRIVTEEIAGRGGPPIPCFIEVMSNGSHPDLSALLSTDRTAASSRLTVNATTRGTAFTHGTTLAKIDLALIIRRSVPRPVPATASFGFSMGIGN